MKHVELSQAISAQPDRTPASGKRAGRAATWPLILAVFLLAPVTGCFEYINDPTGGVLRAMAEDWARQQLLPVAVDQFGVLAFRIQVQTVKTSKRPADVALVEKVKGKILEAVGQTEFAATARQFDWEVVLATDDRVDAVAFPGGKILIWTGLLRRPDTRLTVPVEERLAVVLGHEMVHALARHAAQRIDKELQQALALAMTGKDLSDGGMNPGATAALMTAMGVQYEAAEIRPFTGAQESDADHLGLLITARAGYDPEIAVTFWEQINTLSGGKHAPELLSMHPAYETRISQMKGWMAEAQQHYRAATAGRPASARGHAG